MRTRWLVPAAWAALSGAMLAACSLAPDYKVPDMPLPAAYKEAGDWVAAMPADDRPRGRWWLMFGDPRLNALEDQVAEANQNLKVALAQYNEARAAVGVSRADYFPAVTGGSGVSREATSANVANRSSVRLYDTYSLGIDTSYEIDLWGRVRNAVSAAESEAEAAKADLAGVLLSLQTELAVDYFTLRGDDARLAVLDKTVEADKKAVSLTRDRLRGGIATEADYDQAQTQLENVMTQAADTRLQRAQMEHALAVLVGRMPSAFALPPLPLGAAPPPAPRPGMPSTLLQRRPDIAAAVRRQPMPKSASRARHGSRPSA